VVVDPVNVPRVDLKVIEPRGVLLVVRWHGALLLVFLDMLSRRRGD
jgi:hypothetical protein